MDKDKRLIKQSILGLFIFFVVISIVCILFEWAEFSLKFYAGVFVGWAVFAAAWLRFIPTR